ncbi:F-box protein CPR1-like [Cornus florida]|uniref:F-box protein CPR1-like n=1 Tax=Cornus florida TaxID=4283 RepID=UPI0028975376|nr:F-box protein CPR1-like [Cornus florida]
MSDLHVDVIADILSRLPVKPLLRFRCVSKSWCALIDSQHFIRSHLNRSIETNTNRSIIYMENELYSLNLDSVDDDGTVVLDHPLKNEEEDTELIGSCDGVLCLFNSHKDIALWNPSTRKHHQLPVAPIDFPRKRRVYQNTVYGFGYDSVNDDYKVMRVIEYFRNGDDSFESEVKVYSLKLNLWRRVQDFPYHLWDGENALLANGSLHWVVCRRPDSDRSRLIAAFDFGVEEYRLVPQPDYSDENFEMSLGVLGGWLCLVTDYRMVGVDLCVDIWAMKEYGVKESWTKLFSIAQPSTLRWFDYVRPLAFSKTGGEVLLVQDGERFLWYDLEMKTIKHFEIQGVDFIMEADLCFRSLVPLRW